MDENEKLVLLIMMNACSLLPFFQNGCEIGRNFSGLELANLLFVNYYLGEGRGGGVLIWWNFY